MWGGGGQVGGCFSCGGEVGSGACFAGKVHNAKAPCAWWEVQREVDGVGAQPGRLWVGLTEQAEGGVAKVVGVLLEVGAGGAYNRESAFLSINDVIIYAPKTV